MRSVKQPAKMLKKFLIKHDKQVHRLLEILPGAFSWSAILLLLVGGFIIPFYVAHLVLLFYVFWFYKSVNMAFFSVLTYYRIKASQAVDWVGEFKGFPDWQKVHHVIVIVTYKEPLHILQRTFQSLAGQDMPLKQISPASLYHMPFVLLILPFVWYSSKNWHITCSPSFSIK